MNLFEKVSKKLTEHHEHAKGEKYANKAEKTYEKALAQARSVFEKTKLADLLV